MEVTSLASKNIFALTTKKILCSLLFMADHLFIIFSNVFLNFGSIKENHISVFLDYPY